MKNGFGLLEQLDFGAGAYYYADIPGFASLVNGSHYQSPVSMPVLIILFLIWGFLNVPSVDLDGVRDQKGIRPFLIIVSG